MKLQVLVLLLVCAQLFSQNSVDYSRLVSPRYPLPKTDTPHWQYWKVAHADFDGDGENERVEILAKVEQFQTKGSLGDEDFAWDDSHMWAVRIIEQGGDTTWVYHNILQMSKLDVYISTSNPPSFYLVQSGRATISVYEVFYKGPNNLEIEERARSKFESGARLMMRKNADYWPKK